MNIGIIGAKRIGGTLGKQWVQAGHAVTFGLRNVENPEVRALREDLGTTAMAGPVHDAISFGEVVVFAIPGGAMEQTIRTHAGVLNGKIVIDAANRMGGTTMNSAADFAHYAPGARVYRAFNSLGWENFDNPHFGETVAGLFYCGPNGESQKVVERLIGDVGLRPMYLGGLDHAHLLDAVTGIWFALAFGQKRGRHLAFKVLGRLPAEYPSSISTTSRPSG